VLPTIGDARSGCFCRSRRDRLSLTGGRNHPAIVTAVGDVGVILLAARNSAHCTPGGTLDSLSDYVDIFFDIIFRTPNWSPRFAAWMEQLSATDFATAVVHAGRRSERGSFSNGNEPSRDRSA
jgi:hypothetical protein